MVKGEGADNGIADSIEGSFPLLSFDAEASTHKSTSSRIAPPCLSAPLSDYYYLSQSRALSASLSAPSPASMRFFKRAHAVRLEVRVHDSTVYLGSPDSHSSRSNDSSSSSSSLSSSSTPSASLRGFVRFELDSPRTFESLQVHFVGNLSIQSGATRKHGKAAPAQEHEVLRHEVDLLYDHSPYFEAGTHR